jgi:hypothetical protein
MKGWIRSAAQAAGVASLWLATLACGSDDAPQAATSSAPAASEPAGAAAQPEIAWWTCPMHTSVHQPHAGKCPICGMTLVPVTREAVESGEVRIDAERRERAGIRSEPVVRGPFALSLRAVGRVVADETSLVDVSARVGGFVTRLDVAALGAQVAKGEVLFTLYSPDLLAAQQELLQALRSQQGSDRGDYLVRAARNRLRLWDIAPADIAALEAGGEPQQDLPIRAPVGGYVDAGIDCPDPPESPSEETARSYQSAYSSTIASSSDATRPYEMSIPVASSERRPCRIGGLDGICGRLLLPIPAASRLKVEAGVY